MARYLFTWVNGKNYGHIKFLYQGDNPNDLRKPVEKPDTSRPDLSITNLVNPIEDMYYHEDGDPTKEIKLYKTDVNLHNRNITIVRLYCELSPCSFSIFKEEFNKIVSLDDIKIIIPPALGVIAMEIQED